MNREVLQLLLRQAFGGSVAERRVVARAAGDLADSGRYEAHADVALTPQLIVSELSEAPAGSELVERWNWWIGALEIAHGDYERFLVHSVEDRA